MKIWVLICMAVAILLWFLSMLRRKLSQKKGCIGAIIPAYNEGLCLARSPDSLLRNPYFCRVICVNDGSTDNTEAVMAEVKHKQDDRSVAVTQKSTGKGGALMNGLNYTTYDQVFLSDVNTYVPPDRDGMDYMLAEIECGADAIGGIPSTALKGASLLLRIRATVKLPTIIMKRTLQQFLDGAPSIISNVCGMFRTDVLREFSFPDRTKVEDLDLTWTLVTNGCRIRQANRCIVYPQECSSPREKWCRWWRWVVGYAVCMYLHKRLSFNRLGTFSIFLTLLAVLYDAGIYLTTRSNEFITTGPHGVVLAMFPLTWVGVVCAIGAFSAWFHHCWLLVPLAPLSVMYILLAYVIWTIYGLIAFFTGREPQRGRPTSYSALVEVSTAYSHPPVTGTEKLPEA